MSTFRFIDLFAGIGGIRIAFEKAGGECVFSSEYDKYAQKTYEALHGDRPDFQDIRRTDPLGTLPCCPGGCTRSRYPDRRFSLPTVLLGRGFQKQSLGRPHGFDDPTQGTLFFNVKSILETKRPKAFLLENVKNLRSHDKGNTFAVIQQTLKGVGYRIHHEVIDAAKWVPQHRERIFIVGFRSPANGQKWDVEDFRSMTFTSPKPNRS